MQHGWLPSGPRRAIMYPILFRVGTYVGYTYTLALALGLFAGLWIAYRGARARLTDAVVILDGGFWGLVGGLAGARIAYVAANWAYFATRLGEAVDLRAGGLSWHGAWLGAAIAAALWYAVRRRGQPPPPDWRMLLDIAAPGLALGSAFGWVGCLLGGACYGAEAEGVRAPLQWLTGYLPDIYGVDEVRFLTQPLMIGWSLLLWGILWLRPGAVRALPVGGAFAAYLLLYAIADGLVWFLRGDGTWRYGLWPAQWMCLLQTGVALGLVVHAVRRRRRHDASVLART